jgi:hypothetical protein
MRQTDAGPMRRGPGGASVFASQGLGGRSSGLGTAARPDRGVLSRPDRAAFRRRGPTRCSSCGTSNLVLSVVIATPPVLGDAALAGAIFATRHLLSSTPVLRPHPSARAALPPRTTLARVSQIVARPHPVVGVRLLVVKSLADADLKPPTSRAPAEVRDAMGFRQCMPRRESGLRERLPSPFTCGVLIAGLPLWATGLGGTVGSRGVMGVPPGPTR